MSYLKRKSSTDFFGLSNSLFKQVSPYVVDVLTQIFNLSFSTGVVPYKLKIAVLIPLFKNKDAFLKENYCPISLLPIISKILGKYELDI